MQLRLGVSQSTGMTYKHVTPQGLAQSWSEPVHKPMQTGSKAVVIRLPAIYGVRGEDGLMG